MKNNVLAEISIALILIGLLMLVMNPMDLLMPQAMHLVMVPLIVILIIIFGVFAYKEYPGDEREQLHMYIASRFSYVTAISILTIAVIVQNAQGKVDPWIIIALCFTLLAKVIGIIFARYKH